MKNYTIEMAQKAEADLLELFYKILDVSHDLDTAKKFHDKIKNKIAKLDRLPYVSEDFSDNDYRVIEFPYIIHYSIFEDNNIVLITHIRHGKTLRPDIKKLI